MVGTNLNPFEVKADEEMGESSSMGVTKEIFEQQKRHDLDPILTNRHFWHFMTEKEQLEFLMKVNTFLLLSINSFCRRHFIRLFPGKIKGFL